MNFGGSTDIQAYVSSDGEVGRECLFTASQVLRGIKGYQSRRSWTFMQWVVDLQRSLLKGVLGAKRLCGLNARLVKYLEENKLCQAEKNP